MRMNLPFALKKESLFAAQILVGLCSKRLNYFRLQTFPGVGLQFSCHSTIFSFSTLSVTPISLFLSLLAYCFFDFILIFSHFYSLLIVLHCRDWVVMLTRFQKRGNNMMLQRIHTMNFICVFTLLFFFVFVFCSCI